MSCCARYIGHIGIERRSAAVLLLGIRREVPSQAVIDRQAPIHLPRVLRKGTPVIASAAELRQLRDLRCIYASKEEAGERMPGCAAVYSDAGVSEVRITALLGIEGEVASGVGVGVVDEAFEWLSPPNLKVWLPLT